VLLCLSGLLSSAMAEDSRILGKSIESGGLFVVSVKLGEAQGDPIESQMMRLTEDKVPRGFRGQQKKYYARTMSNV